MLTGLPSVVIYGAITAWFLSFHLIGGLIVGAFCLRRVVLNMIHHSD